MQLTGDAGLEVRVPVTAGPRVVGVSFVRELWEPEGLPQPLQRGRVLTNDEIYMGYAAVGSVQIGGPYRVRDRTVTTTPSRRAIFVCHPDAPTARSTDGRRLRADDPVAHRAARLPASRHRRATSQTLLTFFASGRREGGSFDAGIQFALERMLVDPDFLLRVRGIRRPDAAHRAGGPPPDRPRAGVAAVVLPVEQHSRRRAARPGRARPADASRPCSSSRCGACWPIRARRGAGRRLRRAVAEPAAASARWCAASRRLSRTSTTTCCDAFQQETELFVESTLREDRSVSDLLTRRLHVRQRAAGAPLRHSRRLRQPLPPRHAARPRRAGRAARPRRAAGDRRRIPTAPRRCCAASGCSTTSSASPSPPPPADVDTPLPETEPGDGSRRRSASGWRSTATNPVCASCHAVMDPLGFALENFDAIGAWRTDRRGGQAGRRRRARCRRGAESRGSPVCAALLLQQRRSSSRARVTEKLLAYALGRRLEYYDRPAVRQIVRDAAAAATTAGRRSSSASSKQSDAVP